ncbi:MAG: hypothetical protein NW226_16345 [Microscillaceae bacterium]|nr:hypothetical protein [Microscillaceae bacterium]
MMQKTPINLWNKYLELEKGKLKTQASEILDDFIEATQECNPEELQAWVFEISRQYVDLEINLPIRLPLFSEVIFPVLYKGLKNNEPNCARWLAGYHSFIDQSKEITRKIGKESASEVELLRKALLSNPLDQLATRKMVKALAWQINYSLHEIPNEVYYGNHCAKIEDCDLLLEEVLEFEQLAQSIEKGHEFRALIEIAKIHYQAFKNYLQRKREYSGYQDYCIRHDIQMYKVPRLIKSEYPVED